MPDWNIQNFQNFESHSATLFFFFLITLVAGLRPQLLNIIKFWVADFSFRTVFSSINPSLLSINWINVLWHLEIFAEHKEGMHRCMAGWHFVKVQSWAESSVIKVNSVDNHWESLKVLVTTIFQYAYFFFPSNISSEKIFFFFFFLCSQQNKLNKTSAWKYIFHLNFYIFRPVYLKENSVDISIVLEDK